MITVSVLQKAFQYEINLSMIYSNKASPEINGNSRNFMS